MSIGQTENRRVVNTNSLSRRKVPTPSRRAEDYGDVMRAQSLRAQARMAKLLMGHPDPQPKPQPRPAPMPEKLPIPVVPELVEIAQSCEQRDAEFDDLISRLEVMRVDDEPSKGHRIAHAIAKAYGITFRQMLSKCRFKHIVRARQHAMWAMRKYTRLSMPIIARILGGLDHTTVLHGIRRHQARIDAGEISAQ